MNGTKKSKCPLNVSEWVQYLTSEQNRERYDFYNNEVSFLSKAVMMLAIISAVIGLLNIFNSFKFITDEMRVIYFIVIAIIFGIILIVFRKYLKKFNKIKNSMNKKIELEGDIIEDILNGKLKDSDEINRKYMSIFEK